jgi:hypothetical protein
MDLSLELRRHCSALAYMPDSNHSTEAFPCLQLRIPRTCDKRFLDTQDSHIETIQQNTQRRKACLDHIQSVLHSECSTREVPASASDNDCRLIFFHYVPSDRSFLK